MITSKDIMTDEDVADIVNLSLDTFQERVRQGFKVGELDLRKARQVVMDKRRWWFRADVERVLIERTVVA